MPVFGVDRAPASQAAAGVPTYPTRVPPSAVLRYELRRGILSGQGEMRWHASPDGYTLRIEGTALGLHLLTWSSRGGFDAAGLSPLEFVDHRRRRDPRVATFRRERGVISYSPPEDENELLPGAQDRLSWMIQLAAIVDARPQRFVAGQRVVMQVTGARGDADQWAFVMTGRTAVEVAGATVDGTLAFSREPRKPGDTRVEVWLDPARRHLPVRVKLSTDSDALEFLLKP